MDQWVDAQMIYAYQRYGTNQQYSVAHAMEDLNISTEHLSAHNALHDAVFTARICQKLDIPQGILHYDQIRKESSNPFLYPPILTFFYGMKTSLRRSVSFTIDVYVLSFCPYCQTRLE